MLTLTSACITQNRENMNFTIRVRVNNMKFTIWFRVIWVFCGLGCWKDVYYDLQLLKTEFELETTLILTKNVNPNLYMRANTENG